MTTTLMFEVPRAVQETARAALALHKDAPLEDVSGIALAERLTEGRVTVEDLSAMHRFFGINADHHADRVCEARTAATDPLCRSWDLRGGAHARVWADRHYKRLVGEGVVPADPYDALFKARPDEIYARFQAGAWNWEYGLDSPMRAAKFYEDYHRATGNVLDLGQAFGDSARAVGNAVHRRVNGPDPFREIARALTFEDIEYRLAATVDRAELEESALIGVLFESLKPSVYNNPNAKLTAKMVWPGFVAYGILGSERPELLVDVNQQGMKPPSPAQKPQNLTRYTDAVRTYVTFFHPEGSKWVDATNTEFEGIDDEVFDFVTRAFYGRKLLPKKVQKLLGRMRRWTAQNKLAGSAFHVYNADWKKGNWQHILNAIPEDADVRAAFTEFTDVNPIPADGVKLQQTLSDKKMLAAIAKFADAELNKSSLEFSGPGLLDTTFMSNQRKFAQTMSGKAAEKLGTPIGVQSVFLDSTKQEVVLIACFRDYPISSSQKVDTCILQRDNGQLFELPDNILRDSISNGTYTILKAHKDMLQVYSPAQKGPKDAAPQSSPADVEAQALLDPNVTAMLTSVPLMGEFANVLGLGPAPNDGHKTATEIQWVTSESAFWKAAEKRGWEAIGKWSIDGIEREVVGIVNVTDPDLPGDNIYVLARDKVSKLILSDVNAASKVHQGTMFLPIVPFGAPEVTPEQLAKDAEPEPQAAKTQATDPVAKAQEFYTGAGFDAEVYPLKGTVSHAESVSQGWGPLVFDSAWLYRPSFGEPFTTVEISHAMKWSEVGTDVTGIDIWFKAPAAKTGVQMVVDELFGGSMVKGDAKPDTGDELAPLEGGTPAPDVLTAFVAGQFSFTDGPLTRSSRETEAVNAMGVLDYPSPYDGQEWEADDGASWIFRETLHWRTMQGEIQVGHAWTINGTTSVMTDAAVLGFVVGNTIKPLSSKGTEENPFGFATGDVVKHNSGFVWVVGKHGSPNAFYTVIPLTIGASVEWMSLDAEVLEKTPNIEGNFMNPVALGPFLTGTNGYEKSTEESVQGVSVGDQVTLAHIQGQCLAFFTHADLGMQVVLAAPMAIPVGNQQVDAFDLGAGAVNWQSTDIAETSYEPDEPEPEAIGSDEPDAETGNPLMAGTPVAFKKAKALSVTMATQPEDSTFTWDLGAILHYGNNKTRTIIGYGFKAPSNSPVYLILTEKGTPNWVTTAKANVKYGPTAGYDQGVVDALQPKAEDAAKAKFPKLNYKLSPKAKQVAEKNELVYVPAPKTSKFHVGAKLQWTTDIKGAEGEKTRILGWIATDVFEAAIMDLGTDEWSVLNLEKVNTDLSVHYGMPSSINATGDVTFGKSPESDPISVTNSYDPDNIITIPGPEPEGWDEPTPVNEPSLSHLPKGKHASCGVLAVVPAGATLTSGDKNVKAESASVVLYHPLNEFGGYKLAIPKGTVDKGESTIKAAVREFQEETGLTVKPVAHLGDFRANTSVTRLYIGYVTGGNPATKKTVHEESEATVLKPIPLSDNAYQELAWFSQLKPESGNKWQQQAIIELAEWLAENGIPQNFAIDEADQHSQVTGPSDVQPEKIPQAGTPEAAKGGDAIAADVTDVWISLLRKTPFPVTTAMIAALKKQVNAGVAAAPVGFNAVRSREVGPKYGDVFTTTAGTPYSCAGYISWEGEDGQYYHYLMGLSAAGLVEPLPAQANGAPDLHTSANDTAAAKEDKEAWFSHPDSATNARIQAIYHGGGTLKAGQVGMQTFKVKWLTEAGMTNTAVTNMQLVLDITSLFVPGAASEATRDAVLQCLQARMKSTKPKKGGSKSAGVSTVPTGDIAAPQPIATAPSPIGKSVVVAKPLLSTLALTTLQNPQEDKLTEASGKTITQSSKPTRIVQDEHGNQFFVKWRGGEPFAAETDKASADLMAQIKGNVIPINTLDYKGNNASIQPFFASAKPVSADPSTLADEDMAELLSQHAFDMFVGDHDGNATNWIRVNGKLMAVDRGQAFKFVLMGKSESLDPNWHAPGNFGAGFAKRLLIDWSNGDVEIPSSAFAAMHATIESIESTFTTATLLKSLTPIFDALETPAPKRKAALGQLDTRRKSYAKDWLAQLRKLRKGFKWPSTAAKGLVIDPTLGTFDSTTATVGFGKEEETVIKEAIAAKWQGKTIRVDGAFIENQEVMVRRVLWEEKPGQKVPAALIHFRVTKEGGDAMQKSMLSKAHLDSTDSSIGGPQRLKVDVGNGYYEKIWGAIKSINFHLGKQPDGKPNQDTVGLALALKPTLQAILDQTQNPTGTYGPTGEANEIVNAMSDQYLGYIDTVEYWNANAVEFVGQHSPQFTEFVYEEPAAETVKKAPPPYKLALKNQGASYPTITTEAGGAIVVKNLHKPVINSSQNAQFIIHDPATNGRLFLSPTTGSGGLKSGTQGVKGMCWGIIPGEPSAASVARLLSLMQDATGISTKPPTKKDKQVLYMSQQIAIHQNGGTFTPNADGTSVVDSTLKEGLDLYRQGKVDEALAVLRKRAASATGVGVKELDKLLKSDAIDGEFDARGNGFRRTMRPQSRDDLLATLGNNTYVAHNLMGATSVLDFMQSAIHNGALLSNEVKPFYGVTKQGASPSADFSSGGSSGIFCCFRKAVSSFAVKHVYFDLELARRLDIYIVGTGDSYGNVNKTRFTTPDKWKTKVGSGGIGATSGNQVVVRHDIDLQRYLVKAKCASKSEAAQCIQLVKNAGWTFQRGTPESIFIA